MIDKRRRSGEGDEGGGGAGAVAGKRGRAPSRRREAPGALPDPLREAVAEQLGHDLGDVRLREGDDAAALGADAYAQGDDVVFAPGAYDPDSPEGVELLGHELAHVVQQREGRVAGPQGHGAARGVVAEPGLEAEADSFGAWLMRTFSSGVDAPAAAGGAPRAAAPVQRRVTVNPVAATFEADADVRAMTIQRFVDYTRGQADWSTRYASADEAQLQTLLHDLLAEPALQAGLRPFTVSAVLAVAATDWPALRRYCAAVNDAAAVPTAKMQVAGSLARAIEIGNALPRLEAAVGGGGVLYHITRPDSVDTLIRRARLEELILYCAARSPQWHAADGVELDSFLDMPVGFHLALAPLADVRNLHRFDFTMLLRLMVDRLGGHAGQPLALLLHSGLDHNGAFHHDQQLTDAIVNNPNRVVMLEGKETLAEIEAELPAIAARFGGGRINQVMIAGHGNSRVIELAGRTTLGAGPDGRPEVQQQDDTLDLDHNRAATERFMDTLLGLTGGADSRVVFNGCLTASNDVTLAPGGGDPRAQIASQLASNGSLVETMRARATAAGSSTSIIGANASFPEGPQLLDPHGRFDLIWAADPATGDPGDPALTATDRLEYVRHGREPTGVLRAVLERWEAPAAPPPAWLVAVRDRLTRPQTTWDGAIITTALTHIEASPADAQAISDLAHSVDVVSEAKHAAEARVQRLLWAHAAYRALLFAAVEGSSEWPGDGAVPPIAIYQVWSRSDASKRAALVSHLTSHAFTTSAAGLVLDWSFLTAADLGALLPASAAAAPSRGQLVIACANVLGGAPSTVARDFLRAIARANGNRFPAALDVAGIADDSSEEGVLQAIGLAGGAGGGAAAGTTVDGNVDADGDGTNERYVDRTAGFGEVVNCSVLRVHEGPGNAAAEVGFLHAGDRVFVQGRRGGWCSIDFHGRTGYVWERFLSIT